ncbi:aluminum-activated malate transporter 12-like isoform X2 [Carya illinoinensis]|nr:aluminum-activated malate transporter 12-like isoform X2 [Carya illinoinensis]
MVPVPATFPIYLMFTDVMYIYMVSLQLILEHGSESSFQAKSRRSRKERIFIKTNMGSTVISIPDGEGVPDLEEKKKSHFSLQPIISYLREKKKVLKFSLPPIFSHLREEKTKHDLRKLIHSAKVGTALVLVSLLYLLDPLFKKVGENAMWAIMTVVVIFEFYAGATLSKGLNRGLGTILGGGLGCLAAALAQGVGGRVGDPIVVGVSVFIFAAAATYTRMVPSIKKRYDYGVMIFILTFNLVVVSGIRVQDVMKVARERLSTIGMGFAICIFISLFVFPVWASDELHHSFASKFEDLALSMEGCLEEYFSFMSEKGNQPKANFSSCKSILNSKTKDEALPTTQRETLKEPCEAVGSLLGWTLRELGESILKMRKCHAGVSIVPNLKSTRLELSSVLSSSPSKLMENGNDYGLAMATFVFLLMEVVEKVEEVAKEVEQLGEIAHFRTQLALICPSTLF